MLVIALLALASLAESAQTKNPFYVIAHMANSESAVRYAMSVGGNAVEFDLWFDKNGNPSVVEHTGACDCSCSSPEICRNGLRNSCKGTGASNSPENHLHTLANYKHQLALVIIDSKIDPKISSGMNRAGSRLVQFVDEHLFGWGYRGEVIIGTGSVKAYEYIRSAVEQAKHSSNKSKYYFTFDQMKNDYDLVASALSQLDTERRAFGTGITACLPGDYKDGIRRATTGINAREIGLSYIWTLDKESSMDEYIDLGVTGIMTNNPERLKKIANRRGMHLATPNDSIPKSTTFVPRRDNDCDCDYHKGGCIISLPAPPNRACRCKYKGAWTCGGSLTSCSSGAKCKQPDGSLESCRLGGGDCDAYK